MVSITTKIESSKYRQYHRLATSWQTTLIAAKHVLEQQEKNSTHKYWGFYPWPSLGDCFTWLTIKKVQKLTVPRMGCGIENHAFQFVGGDLSRYRIEILLVCSCNPRGDQRPRTQVDWNIFSTIGCNYVTCWSRIVINSTFYRQSRP